MKSLQCSKNSGRSRKDMCYNSFAIFMNGRGAVWALPATDCGNCRPVGRRAGLICESKWIRLWDRCQPETVQEKLFGGISCAKERVQCGHG